MNRATFIEKLTEMQHTVEQLLKQLQANEADRFVAHLYQARRQYRRVSERPNKGTKAIEREFISSFQVAQSLGFKGDFRQLGASAPLERVELRAQLLADEIVRPMRCFVLCQSSLQVIQQRHATSL